MNDIQDRKTFTSKYYLPYPYRMYTITAKNQRRTTRYSAEGSNGPHGIPVTPFVVSYPESVVDAYAASLATLPWTYRLDINFKNPWDIPSANHVLMGYFNHLGFHFRKASADRQLSRMRGQVPYNVVLEYGLQNGLHAHALIYCPTISPLLLTSVWKKLEGGDVLCVDLSDVANRLTSIRYAVSMEVVYQYLDMQRENYSFSADFVMKRYNKKGFQQ